MFRFFFGFFVDITSGSGVATPTAHGGETKWFSSVLWQILEIFTARV